MSSNVEYFRRFAEAGGTSEHNSWRCNVTNEVIIEKEGPVARLILNRPDKHNALSFAGLDQLVQLLNEAADDDAMKVIMLKCRGLYLVELVDLAIAADSAKFSHAEQRLGLAGNTWQLNAQILMYGPKKARELLLLAEEFDGQTAVQLGLVNRSVPEDAL